MHRTQAVKLENYVKTLQVCQSEDAVVTMTYALKLFGAHTRSGYPNWAIKYFLDALMLKKSA